MFNNESRIIEFFNCNKNFKNSLNNLKNEDNEKIEIINLEYIKIENKDSFSG